MLVGGQQDVICETKGSRPKTMTSWWLEREEMRTATLDTPTEDENLTLSTLRFTPRPEDNGKTLICKSVNPVLPKTTLQTEVKLEVQWTPEPAHECIVNNRSSHSLAVECKPGYNGSLPSIYHMEIYNSVAEYMAENVTNADRPKFEVSGLSPSTSYVLVVYASNTKGRSKSVALVASTLSPPEKRIAREVSGPLNIVLGAVIGIIAITVILTIVIIIIIRSRSARSVHEKGKYV
ncbi:fibronectin type-III domain-containing protein [Trichonephila inaurata madagascariensis]|uniref:Fibronectin type-III domain-containing protein n=1 Tax=Trichonephila inaurata madagascariensis TaxID=2747483 RepID=A0A8X6IY30_9ARAC|nr:fibronectin type-III domain-containing protein [Trichonephila inaurata madagascariensis]